MRLFAAIFPPDEIRDRLIGVQAGAPGGRLTPWENLHLTLGFFGDVDERGAEDLHAALSKISAPRFDIWADGAGAFGGSAPRLLYAGVRESEALTRLQAKVSQAARDAGLETPGERFTPHFTLSRLRRGEVSPARAAKWLEGRAAFLAGPIEVEAFGLYRSRLGHGGAAYERLKTYALTGRATARSDAQAGRP